MYNYSSTFLFAVLVFCARPCVGSRPPAGLVLRGRGKMMTLLGVAGKGDDETSYDLMLQVQVQSARNERDSSTLYERFA